MKTLLSRQQRWNWALVLLIFFLGGVPVPYPDLDQNAADGKLFSLRPVVVSWRTLAPAAYAEASSDYLVQTERALLRIDDHMTRLSRIAVEVGPLTRCSFEVERRKYYDIRDTLIREIRQVRADRFRSADARRKIESRLAELENTYSRAIACYE